MTAEPPADETRREEARWRIARLRAVLNRTAEEEPTSPLPQGAE